MPKRVQHVPEEEAAEDSDQMEDTVDQCDDDDVNSAAKRFRGQTSTALKDAKSLGKVIKVRRP